MKNREDFFVLGHVIKKLYLCTAFRKIGVADCFLAKEKRSKKENYNCTKGCYVLRVHVTPDVTPFCNTNKKIMNDFQQLWALLRQHGSSAKRETECAALWATYPPDMQQRIYATIRTKLEQGKFVHYDPLRALEENARPPRQQTLSYADYYARYHTTEPRDGWQMANPTGNKVIYVKG